MKVCLAIVFAIFLLSCSIFNGKVRINPPSLNPEEIGCSEKKECVFLSGLSYKGDAIEIRVYACDNDSGKVLIISKDPEVIVAAAGPFSDLLRKIIDEKLSKDVDISVGETCEIDDGKTGQFMGVLNWRIK